MGYVDDRLKEIASEVQEAFSHKHIERYKTRHGRTNYYFRIGKGKRIRLPNRDEVTDAEFRKAYAAAERGAPATKPKRAEVKPTFGAPGRPGHVYFVRDGESVKIGFTTSIKQRVKSIQTSCAEPLDVLMVMPGTDETEKFFHRLFADYRIGGEWFKLTGLLAEFVGYRVERQDR